MSEVVTILLAAGLSRRMGAQNKLLLPIGGRAMIAHMAETYRAATGGQLLVVTGHEWAAVAVALQGSAAKLVFNPDYAAGQPTSVACGLRAANSQATLLIGLGDQPHLRPADIAALLAAHRAGDPNKISIPVRGAARGNPIVVPGNLRSRLLADPNAPGCKRFSRTHPEHVQFHPLPAPGFYRDIDTPEDFAALTDIAPPGIAPPDTEVSP